MKRRAAWALEALGGAAATTAGMVYLTTLDAPVLDPKGRVALEEQRLVVGAAALSLLVVIPVLGHLVGSAVRYRV